MDFSTTFRFTGLLKQTYGVIRHDPRTFLGFALIIAIPLSFANEYFLGDITPKQFSIQALAQTDSVYALLFLNAIIGSFGDIIFVLMTENALKQRMSSPRHIFLKATGWWYPVVITLFLKGVIVFGLSLLLVVPGIIWMNYYTFATQAVVMKGERFKAALNASKMLVQGRWWEVLGVNIVVWLYYIFIGMMISAIANQLTIENTLLGSVTINMLGNIFSAAGVVFITLYFEHVWNTLQKE